MKTHFFQMELKAVENRDNALVIEGFASTPDVDRHKDIVEPSAFDAALEMYKKNPVLLFQHDQNRPVGNVTSVTITDKGLKVTAEVRDAEIKEMVSDGRLRAFSIGFVPLATELRNADGTAFDPMKQNVWDADLIRVIKSLDLAEISIVSVPSNGNALFTMAKSVKSYFNQMAYKSMNLTRKDGSETEQAQAVEAPNEVPVEEAKAEEKPAEEAPEKEEDKPEETDEKEVTEEKAAPAVEDTTNEPTNGEQPQENGEKGDETAPADSGEAQKGEEPKAEPEPVAAAEGKALIVTKSVANELNLLAKAGLIQEAKANEKAVTISKEAVEMVKKLLGAMQVQDDELAEKNAEIKRLNELLEKTPAKSALAPTGEQTQLNVKNEAGNKKTAPSPEFLRMFNLR